jgi:tetratricopeptide (TPR) repeat protein
MLALRRIPVEVELVKWMLLALAAALVATLLATRMAAGDTAPALLPDDIDRVATPMPPALPYYPEVGPPVRTNEPNQRIWRVIQLHRAGQVEEAIVYWQRNEMAAVAQPWRNVALAAAYLQTGQLQMAEEQLDAAQATNPANGVVHYYTGLLRLAQADRAHDWYDVPTTPAIMLIALPQVFPNTRGMYETMAMQELQMAIEFADATDLQAPLAPEAWAAEDMHYLPLVTPTAADLVEALGADHFAARAHNVLATLNLERGLADEAEEHLDAAALERMHDPLAYRKLAQAYEHEDRGTDAARAYLKGFRRGDANLIPAIRAFIHLWKGDQNN